MSCSRCELSEGEHGLRSRVRWRRGFQQVGNRPAMHEVGADEPRKGERARHDPAGLMRQTQQQEGDQRGDDLNPNRILGGAEEVGNLQSVLDPAKEQLDVPSALVQSRDVLGFGVEIVGEDPQHLAGVDNHLDLACGARHRIAAGGGEPRRQMADAIADDRRSRRHRPFFDDAEARIGLQARDDATSGIVELRPPAIVVIAEIKCVTRSGLDRHRLGSCDVVDVARGDHQIERLIGIRIVDDMRFGAANARRERRPIRTQAAQPHAGRVDQTDTIVDFAPISALQLRHQGRQHGGKDLGPRRRRVRIRQRRARDRLAAKVIELAGVATQVRLDLAQAAQAKQLSQQQRNQMRLGRKRPRVAIGFVLRLTPLHRRPSNRLQNIMKDDIVVTHGLGPFSIQLIRNLLESRRINAVHLFKHKLCRTVVRRARA
jgi:hypothetical protein